MKKTESQSMQPDDMKKEYDFPKMKEAVRGKYHKKYREGHSVIVHHEDGTDTIHYFKLEEGAVMLEPDVREYFTSSEEVNKALRALIEIIPYKKRETRSKAR